MTNSTSDDGDYEETQNDDESILLKRGACSCESLLAPCDKESVSLKNEATLFTFIILILSKSSTTTTIGGLDQVRGYTEDIFSDRS